jgi:hypothetical protein
VKDEVRYQQWERECAEVYDACDPDDGPPFPSPTPYTQEGGPWSTQQRVHLTEHLAVQAALSEGARVDDERLYLVTLTWFHSGADPLPLSATAVRLHTTVPLTTTDPAALSGTLVFSGDRVLDSPASLPPDATSLETLVVVDATWTVSEASLDVHGAALTASIAPGEQTTTFPILAADGAPTHVSLWLVIGEDLVTLVFDQDALLDPPCPVSMGNGAWAMEVGRC